MEYVIHKCLSRPRDRDLSVDFSFSFIKLHSLFTHTAKKVSNWQCCVVQIVVYLGGGNTGRVVGK